MHLCYTPLISWIADGMDLMMKVGYTLAATVVGHYSSSCCPDRSEQYSSVCEEMQTTGLSSPKLYPSPPLHHSLSLPAYLRNLGLKYKASSIIFLWLFEQVHALLNVKISLFHHLGCSIQCPCIVLYGSLNITSTRMHTY